MVDAPGNPIYIELSGGQVSDNTPAIGLLANIDIKDTNILGDKACGTKEIRTYITSQDADYTITPKQNTKEP